jgi:predicted nucleic-acid-binding Zn-ribbon protein
MSNFRCPKCGSFLAREEGNKLIFRTGFGKRKVFHVFNKEDATITCWSCKEIRTYERRRKRNGRTFERGRITQSEPIIK